MSLSRKTSRVERQAGEEAARIAVAPMMDWTDRHCRYFLRTLNANATLYTEMITADALHHGDRERLLAFDEHEHPVVLQLGGSDPQRMASAAEQGARYGYDEININVGCPSDRVQSGRFGACLMAKPRIVADCVSAMTSAVEVPVTVKTRIGIDDQDSYAFLRTFVDEVAAAGCRRFIVHARKAILTGLSPKENRSIPPLDYARVYQLKRDYPELDLTINGGVKTVEDVRAHLRHVDGVMIGREAYSNPWFLAELASAFGSHGPASRRAVVLAMLPYIERALATGVPLKNITRHMLGLFAGQPGARAWRRSLSEFAHRPGAGLDVVTRALGMLPAAA
ncbi:MAG: tRNA dihydrouridine(20/20a) synthase DusA [Gammaproteobacteria bacterium]|nr:tRNA dihydrouridine(20/20a) synthase DusA [Gammaproteobacteria bacterium]